MKCPFCDDENITAWDTDVIEHLVLTENRSGHTHIHGPIDNPGWITKFVNELKPYTQEKKERISYRVDRTIHSRYFCSVSRFNLSVQFQNSCHTNDG